MHEDLLRHIWAKQLFDAHRLTSTDGRSVRIKHPGTLHRGSGPDFHDAVVEVGGTTFRGDVEFHRTFNDWKLHNHQSDPGYNSVILHVVLQGNVTQTFSQSGRIIPTIVLEKYLRSPLSSIADQLLREEFLSRTRLIKCSSRNDAVVPRTLLEWFRSMYQERLLEKVTKLHDRLCDIILSQRQLIGEPYTSYNQPLNPDDIPIPESSLHPKLFQRRLPWEQLLFEEIMDGLGYSQNRAPMKQLAERASLVHILALRKDEPGELSPQEIQSVLLNVSSLLPRIDDTIDQDSKVLIHQYRSLWNSLATKPSFHAFHPSEWIFSPTRPSNFPTIRVVSAGMLIHKILYQSLFKAIITIIDGKYSSPASKIDQLVQLFSVGNDSFWNYHYSFTEATRKKHSILGRARILDILVNTVIPFTILYANMFNKNTLSDRCLLVAAELPPLEGNTILKQMNTQLIKGKIKLAYAYQQQGVLQLYKRYCVPQRCGECTVGKIVL